jgi:hypothetical protein
MTGNWEYFPCTIGEYAASIFVDVSMVDRLSECPVNLVRLSVIYKNPREDGLPTRDEYQALSDIEDCIVKTTGSGDRYVGRRTYNKRRQFYIYSARPKADWKGFAAELADQSRYDIRMNYEEDAARTGYTADLYPSQDDWQIITDLRVIESLRSEGDDGSAPRLIDHWAYFPLQDAARRFAAWAQEQGFTELREGSYATDRGDYCVRLSHEGTVRINAIGNRTIALNRAAREHGGNYDGWETPVIKTEDPAGR